MEPIKVTLASVGAPPLEQPLSPKRIRYYDISVYKNELAEELRVATPVRPRLNIHTKFVVLLTDGTLVIKAGFPWDGASGPTWDTPSSVRGSCVHDALYLLERKGMLSQDWREAADVMIRDICVEDGMWEWRATMWYKILRAFAASAAKANAKMEAYETVLEAP